MRRSSSQPENFFEWLEGSLDANVWHGLESAIDDILDYPGVQRWWQTRAHWYSQPFREFVQAKITGSGSSPRLYGESG